jgi:hypothetical protein
MSSCDGKLALTAAEKTLTAAAKAFYSFGSYLIIYYTKV